MHEQYDIFAIPLVRKDFYIEADKKQEILKLFYGIEETLPMNRS